MLNESLNGKMYYIIVLLFIIFMSIQLNMIKINFPLFNNYINIKCVSNSYNLYLSILS